MYSIIGCNMNHSSGSMTLPYQKHHLIHQKKKKTLPIHYIWKKFKLCWQKKRQRIQIYYIMIFNACTTCIQALCMHHQLFIIVYNDMYNIINFIMNCISDLMTLSYKKTSPNIYQYIYIYIWKTLKLYWQKKLMHTNLLYIGVWSLYCTHGHLGI
jgi:hypothetical protein